MIYFLASKARRAVVSENGELRNWYRKSLFDLAMKYVAEGRISKTQAVALVLNLPAEFVDIHGARAYVTRILNAYKEG